MRTGFRTDAAYNAAKEGVRTSWLYADDRTGTEVTTSARARRDLRIRSWREVEIRRRATVERSCVGEASSVEPSE